MKIMVKVKEFIFGKRAEPVCQIKEGVHTVQPKRHSKDYGEWCSEFNVGGLYGKNPLKERLIIEPNWN